MLPEFYLIKNLIFENPKSLSSAYEGDLIMTSRKLEDVIDHLAKILTESTNDNNLPNEHLNKYHLADNYYLIWMTDGDIDSIAKYLHDQLDKMTSNAYNLQIIEEDYINRMHVWPTSNLDEESIFSDLVRESFYDHIHKISY